MTHSPADPLPTMNLLTTCQKADLRVALIDELVAAKSVAFDAETLARRVIRSRVLDHEFTVAQAEHELGELVSLELAKAIPDAVTRAIHYQATPKGIVARS